MDDAELALRLSGDPTGALTALHSVGEGVSDLSGEIVKRAAEMVAAIFSVEKAFEALHEGIIKADEIRDLALSLDTFTHSTEASSRAMEYFESVATRTRSTAHELASVFRDLLPLGTERGFSQEGLAEVSTMLSQIATVSGQSLEGMESGFRQLLFGRVTGARGNPLLASLGFTKQDIDNLNWDEVVKKMQELASHAEQFGASWKSTMDSVKESWGIAFGEGFNEALGHGRQAFKDWQDLLTNHDVQDAISAIGYGLGLVVDSAKELKTVWQQITSDPVMMTLLGVTSTEAMSQYQRGLEGQQSLKDIHDRGVNALQQAGLYGQMSWNTATNVGMSGLQGDALQSLLGGTSGFSVTGMSDDQFIRAVGSAQSTLKPEAFKHLLDDLSEYAKKGRIDISDWQAALADARKESDHAADSSNKFAHGLVDTAKAAREAAAAAKELADAFQEVATKGIEAGIGGVVKGLPPGISPTDASVMSMLAPLGFQNVDRLPFSNSGYGNALFGTNPGDLALYQQQLSRYHMPYIGLDQVNPAIDQQTLQNTKDAATSFSTYLKESLSSDAFERSVAQMLIAAAEDGGQAFGKAAARMLQTEFAAMIETVLKHYIPERNVDQKGNVTYTINGKKVSNLEGEAIGDTITGVEAGFAGYGAGLSGKSGSRTMADIEGGVAGFASGGPMGAVVGLLGAVIGGFIGAQQRQADYQYGIPTIGENGIATLTNTKNLTPAAIAQIQSQIQEEYDQIHSGLLSLILKFPDMAIPSFDEINGKFQDNPSAHWGEHLQQWITHTLPETMINALGDELATGFEQLGLSKERFGKIFDFLKTIDPAKAVQEMNQLADALRTLFAVLPGEQQSVFDFFHGTMIAPDIIGHTGSSTYESYSAMLGVQSRMLPGERISRQYDQQIFKDYAALNSGGLSPEEQIQYITEIANLSKQRYDAEKQAIQEILQTAQAIHAMYGSAEDQATVEGMVNADGSPNYAQRSRFYQNKANKDLADIQNATNAADVAKASQQYISDLTQAEQLAIQGGGSLQDWNKWLKDNLPKGEAAADSALNRLGKSIDTTNDTFNKTVDPALLKWTGLLDAANDPLSHFRDGVIGIIEPIDHLHQKIEDLGGAVEALTHRINAAQGGGASSRGGFISRTVAQRYGG